VHGDYSFFVSNDPAYPLQGGLTVSDERIKTACVYLSVSDISASLEKVKANGGKVLKEKYYITPDYPRCGAKLEDTEGNVWLLYCDEGKK